VFVVAAAVVERLLVAVAAWDAEMEREPIAALEASLPSARPPPVPSPASR
jgi:hypothetical protein